MTAKLLIIDGYNLLHAAGWVQSRYRPGELEACRTRLLKFLSEHLSEMEAVRTTVVFDARHPPVAAPRFITHGHIRVLFASPHGDADRMIEEMLESSDAPRNVTLISNDRRLQLAARAERSDCISSTDFLESLRNRSSQSSGSHRANTEKPESISNPAELELWLRVFGDISITALEKLTHATPPVGTQQTSPPKASTTPTQAPVTQPPVAPPQPTSQKSATSKRRKTTREKNSIKPLTADVNEWLAWANEVQTWLDELQCGRAE
jgi:hypothetical protein